MKRTAAVLVAAIAAAVAAALAAESPSPYHVASTHGAHERLLAADGESWRPAEKIAWGPDRYTTTFRALWAERGPYLRFDAADDFPWFTMTGRDDHLWEEEVVEVFLDIGRSGRNYAELEISPGNYVCDVRMVQPHPDKKMDFAWNIEGLETRTMATPGRPGSSGNWTALAFVPWTAFRSLPSASAAAIPPRPGTRWRFNVFRVKRPGGPMQPERGAIEAAWSKPSLPSFHVPAAFRDFVFEAGGAGK
jgi:hypothetical protein